MRSVLHFSTRLYLILVVLTCVPAGAGSAVLCVVPNGHVAIETGKGRCADYSPSARGTMENTGVRTVPDGCGDCVDVPVGNQALRASRQASPNSGSQPLTLSPMVLGGLGTDSYSVAMRSAAALGTRPLPAFPPSRTTILRN